MAKKKKKKAPPRAGKAPKEASKKSGKKSAKKEKEPVDADAVRAYHEKHGWKSTLKRFRLGTKEASAIISGDKPKKKKSKKKTSKKAAKSAAPKTRKKKKRGKKKRVAKKGKGAEAPYGLKKDGTPKKPPGRKAGKKAAKKAGGKTPKKRAKKKRAKREPVARVLPSGSKREIVLDWLLDYRGKKQKVGHMLPLDSVIIDLTTSIRGK